MFLFRSVICLNCRPHLKSSFDISYVLLTKRCLATAAKDDQLPKVREGAASSVTSKAKPTRQPFVKNIFAGVFDEEMLLYPELPNDRLFELNSKVGEIEQFLKKNGKSVTNGLV